MTWLWTGWVLGDSPTSSVKRLENDPSEVQPTVIQTSVTDIVVLRSNDIARSIRRVINHEYGVSPNASLNERWKCPTDIKASRASAGTSSGSA
jgi:predicted transcriptional regulator